MDYNKFKKEYYKTIKKVDSEMLKCIHKHEDPNSIIFNDSYIEGYTSFKETFIDNNDEKNIKIYFDIFQNIHFSILDAFKIELFSSGYNNMFHLVSPNAFNIENLYDNNLGFVFLHNYTDLFHIPSQSKLIISPNEVKIASSYNKIESPIIIHKNSSLHISSYYSNFYIFDELAKKYLESFKESLFPKIKIMYDIANQFNVKNIQSIFINNDLPNLFFLDQKNIEKNQKKIIIIKEILTLLHDITLNDNDLIIENKITINLPLKKKINY